MVADTVGTKPPFVPSTPVEVMVVVASVSVGSTLLEAVPGVIL